MTAGKGRPTPKRSEAERRRRYQLAPEDRKAAAKQTRTRDRAERARKTEAMRRGEEWALPAKDKGPVRALARDYVDSKRRFSEFYMYGLVVLLFLLFLHNPVMQTILPVVLIVMVLIMAGEGFWIGRKVAKLADERYPGQSTRGIKMYSGMRALQIRQLRFPKPRVKPGARSSSALASLPSMEHRHLGRSGLKVSEIAYGNWITHGSQVEEEAALACVAAALDEGITTFDTADVYAGTRAEDVLGRALHGVRRESIEMCTKVFWPTGPGANDRGLSRKHIMESAHASLRRLQTDYLDLYQAHRYDHETPLTETLRAFDDLVRQGKVLYIGVSEWRAEEIAAALRIADEMGFDRMVSNQPQYNMIWRVIESEVIPLSEQEGIGQIVWSPIAQGVLTGKYQPGQPVPAGSRATDPSGSGFIQRLLDERCCARWPTWPRSPRRPG